MKNWLKKLKFKLELELFVICDKYVNNFKINNRIASNRNIIITQSQPLYLQTIKHFTQLEVDNHPLGLEYFINQTKEELLKEVNSYVEFNVAISESSIGGYTIHCYIRIIKTNK